MSNSKAKFVEYPCGCYTEYIYSEADRKTQSETLFEHIKRWLKDEKSHTEPCSCTVFLCKEHQGFLKGLDEFRAQEGGY